jgi:ribosomal protein S18 acetylase RimI-like enzyme
MMNPAISLRQATGADAEVIADLVAGDASSEAASLAGGVDRARAFIRAVDRASNPPSWTSAVVAVQHGVVCAVLQQGPAEEDVKASAGLLAELIRAWGVLPTLRLLPRGIALQRVQIRAPSGSWVVREVHVRPELRNQGVGALLLRRAEEDAVRSGHNVLALTTRTNNPARRLYQRLGYTTVATRTNRRYERYSGAEGRILMVKKLPDSST